MSILALVKAFNEIAKDLHGDYVEHWLQGEVNDYDMDMMLIDEKKHRALTYKRIAEFS